MVIVNLRSFLEPAPAVSSAEIRPFHSLTIRYSNVLYTVRFAVITAMHFHRDIPILELVGEFFHRIRHPSRLFDALSQVFFDGFFASPLLDFVLFASWSFSVPALTRRCFRKLVFIFEFPTYLLAARIILPYIDCLAVELNTTGDDMDMCMVGVVVPIGDPRRVAKPHLVDVLVGDIKTLGVRKFVVWMDRKRRMPHVFVDSRVPFSVSLPLSGHLFGCTTTHRARNALG
jgi:hypothetical protein